MARNGFANGSPAANVRRAGRAPVKALVLTGGAARGVYAAGVVEALLASESFDIVCGSSVGALNGMAVALDRPDLLRDFWSTIGRAGILRWTEPLASIDRLRRNALALRRGSAAERLGAAGRVVRGLPSLRALPSLRRLLSAFDQSALRAILEPVCDLTALRRTLIIGVTDLTHAASATFHAFPADPDGALERAYRAAVPDTHRLTADNLVDALCASSALPGAFAPVEIRLEDGTAALFSDGGIANNAPIGQAIDAGADDVTIVLLQHSGLRWRERSFRSLGDVGFVMHDIIQEHILELELRYVRALNEEVLRGSAPPERRFVDLRVIGPSVPLRLSALSFDDQASIDRVYKLGFADGRAAQSVRPL